MTLSTTGVRSTTLGPGSTGTFSFKITAPTDLAVYKVATDGTPSLLVYPTQYTVSGVGDAAGGSITLATALLSGESIVMVRATPSTQPTSLRSLGTFLPESHEDALDRLTMIAQQHDHSIAGALRLHPALNPDGTSLALVPETGKVLAWGASGISNSTLDSSADVALPGDGRTTPTLSALLANNPGTQYHVLDYNAKTDGTDATARIQATINACPPGGEVILRGGAFRCASGLTINKPITIVGGDNRNSNLPDANSLSSLFFTTDVAVGINATANLCLKSLIISGIGLGVATGDGVRTTNCSLVAKDVVIQAWNLGLRATQGYYHRFNNLRTEYNTTSAIFDNCYDVTAVGCAFNSRGAIGIELLNGSRVMVFGGSMESFLTAGYYLFGGSKVSLFGHYFEGQPALADVGRAVILADHCSAVAVGCHVYLTNNNKQFIGVEGGGTVGTRVYSRCNDIIYPTDSSSVQVYSPALDSTGAWDVADDNWQSDAGAGVQYVNAGFANTVPAIGFGQYSFRYPVDFPDALHHISTIPPALVPSTPNVASAATIALPRGYKVVTITGTTNITSITATGHTDTVVILKFAGALTLTDGSNLKLNGNFVTTADDTITLACDGTNWYEAGRSAN